MCILPKFAKVLTLLSLGFLSTQALAQNFCSTTGHSGNSKKETGSYAPGSIGQYDYQLWYDHANSASATFYENGSMSCAFSGAGDYLCRMGLQFNSNKTYDQMGGDIMAEFKLVKKNISGVDYSYVGVYGWMEGVSGAPNGLVEYYVVDNTLAQYMPGDWVGNVKKGDYTIDGAVYTVYRNTRTGPAIGGQGNKEFHQYFSIRKSARDCGTINVSAHIKKWKELGMADGKLYEAKVLGEAGSNGGGVSGEADFPVAKVYIANGTNPTSSSSGTNPTSSSAVVNPVDVTNIPGTVELENFATNGGDEVTVYGNIVGEIKPNAWLEYPISVTSAGVYNVELLAARQDDQSRTTTVDISVDGKAVASITGILTNGWDDFNSFTGETTNLTAGSHTLRVTFTGGYVNVDNLKFTKKSTTSSSSVKQSSSSVIPPSSSSAQQSSSSVKPSSSSQAPVVVATLPGAVEFEDYQSTGGADLTKNATSLGTINPGAWVEYTVDFTSAGYYDFEVMAARQDNDGNKSYLTIAIDGTDIGTVTDILTTSWTDFQPFSGTSTKEIAAGEHTLRVTFDYGWIDADKITFTKREISSSSEEPPSSSSVEPPPSSSSEVPPSSSSVEPPPSSSSEVPPSSSSVEPPPSSSSEEPPSSSSVEPPPSSSSEVPPSSSSVEPPPSSSSEEPPSSSSVEPPPSSSSVVPPSSSSVEPPPSSSSEEPPSSSSVEPPPSSSSEVIVSSSESVEPPLSSSSEEIASSATIAVLYSSSSLTNIAVLDSTVLDSTIMNNNGPVQLVYGPVVQMDPVVDQGTDAIGNIRMTLSDRNVQVFDVQGRNLGLVRVSAGTSLEDALFAKFHRPGIYLVKQGSRMMKVRVSR